jgi:CRISPR-associated protein Csd1
MWRVAVRGEPIPEAALAKAFSRVKVDILKDEPLNLAGMGLLKAYHVRNNRIKGGKTMVEDMKPYLNENHPHPAYQCGWLLAVLSKLQKSALGDVGAGIIQRYYAAASSTPALVIGRLTRNSQAHLNKLQPGLATWYEKIIAGIWGRMKDNVPATLTLEEQTLFALGYYQQMAYREAAASEKENQIKEG